MKKIFLIIQVFLILDINAQVITNDESLKIKLNSDGSHFIKATFLNQIWVRYTQDNPGSTIDGYEENESYDIGLRRTRAQFLGQLSDKVFFYTQIGQNNINYNGARKQGLFIHDAIGELKIYKEYLSIGTGLTGWSGLSRYASPSVGSILSLDAPLYQQATNDVNDQFLRKYSIYAKGKINKLDYRLVLSKPMTISNSVVQNSAITSNSTFASSPAKMQLQSYVMWQFLDKESNQIPYNIGSYLGKKKVFNLGIGFISQKNAMWHSENLGLDTIYSNLLLLAVDLFYDVPLNAEKETAITTYFSFSKNDYGKNYLRNIGAMNPANGVNSNGSLNGSGNSFPVIGSGKTLYGQIGYLFRKNLLKTWGTLQPFVTSQYSQFDLLKDPMWMYEAGFNWLLDKHRTKISFNYQSRPIFNKDDLGNWISDQRKGMFVMQFQISI